jgi:hypothetical protein
MSQLKHVHRVLPLDAASLCRSLRLKMDQSTFNVEMIAKPLFDQFSNQRFVACVIAMFSIVLRR